MYGKGLAHCTKRRRCTIAGITVLAIFHFSRKKQAFFVLAKIGHYTSGNTCKISSFCLIKVRIYGQTRIYSGHLQALHLNLMWEGGQLLWNFSIKSHLENSPSQVILSLRASVQNLSKMFAQWGHRFSCKQNCNQL